MNNLTREFTQTVKHFYKKNGRVLPWRKTHDPYKILISEIMLQQTQVKRVIPKYKQFINQYPNVRILAAAPLSDVLRSWQGLGYNRRARMLHLCAKEIVERYKEVFPCDEESLRSLPGIGPYTASALMAFSFNKPTVMIETNIRSVYLHHFFSDAQQVSDKDLLKLVTDTLPKHNVCEWYWALMDYGTHIKKQYGNLNKKSTIYKKQSTFKGSSREARGAILRALSQKEMTLSEIKRFNSSINSNLLQTQVTKLMHEGMIVKNKNSYLLPV